MKIQTYMVENPITIKENTSIRTAIELMKEKQIRHLPVVTDERILAGWLTLADLKQGLMPSMLSDVSLSDLVNRNPITVAPDDDIEEAAKIIYSHKISGMPVVEGKKMVGVITESDIFRAFIEMMGILTASSRIDVVAGEAPGAFRETVSIIQDNGADIISVGQTPLPDSRRVYHIRLRLCETDSIKKALEGEGFEVISAMD
ncbi:MAG: CBS domain-containing protein [Deltaproteobacteria bacterium]|nr:CBS domain-containing protein [Deltaproteobacteria bacterium]